MMLLPSLLDNRLYVRGFYDQNFIMGNTIDRNFIVVADTQFGLRLYKGLHAVTELRYNGFLAEQDRFGIALGLEYKINF